ncbi:MAG: vitamin K epoxide reductase family protein [Candidatus Promineifilaceae bacterium]|nr:vitamin K epoxide reductase family protein [Candidatus Promineifilaceae bacterium]
MRTESWPEDWQLRVIQLLAVPGLLLSYFLLLYHNGDLINVCEPSGWDDCGSVSGPDAPYSSIGPIPVALIGMLGYAAIFGVIWLKDWILLVEDYLPELMIGLTGFALLMSLGLTVLEIFVIQAICRYCVISAVIVIIMFVLALSYLRSFNPQRG